MSLVGCTIKFSSKKLANTSIREDIITLLNLHGKIEASILNYIQCFLCVKHKFVLLFLFWFKIDITCIVYCPYMVLTIHNNLLYVLKIKNRSNYLHSYFHK